MDYQTTLKYLYESAPMFQQVGSKAYKEGLENTLALDKYFAHPHRSFRTIHIGGTNGKGSCSHTLAAILQSAGYRVGLYTSPHLIDFRERIRVNGETISEEYVIDFVEKHRSFFEPLYPSFFELTTAMAFKYFADMKIDVAIIEVGMGGRLDCTNIIHPDLSVITNVSLDHTQFLGNTIRKIAKEKAGIIKQGVPVVIGRTGGGSKAIFTRVANEMNASISFAQELKKYKSYLYSFEEFIKNKEKLETHDKKTKGQLNNQKEQLEIVNYWIQKKQGCRVYRLENEYGRFEVYGELMGGCQIENGRTVLATLEKLRQTGYSINQAHIQKGFSEVCEMTGLMGRWQQLQSRPTLICDTGHNVDGISGIVNQLNSLKESGSYQNLHFVFGMVNDKDISGVLKLLPKDAIYYFTQASVQRALPANELMKQATEAGLQGSLYRTVTEAVRAAQEKSLPEDFIFVGGSSFIVADLLSNRHTLNLD